MVHDSFVAPWVIRAKSEKIYTSYTHIKFDCLIRRIAFLLRRGLILSSTSELCHLVVQCNRLLCFTYKISSNKILLKDKYVIYNSILQYHYWTDSGIHELLGPLPVRKELKLGTEPSSITNDVGEVEQER